MLLKYILDKALAQATYMVADTDAGVALIIDPSRDISPYLEVAAQEDVRIAHIAETHIHADFASGARELAEATGARLYLSAEGGPDWQYAYHSSDTRLLHDRDSWMVGKVKIEALHTAGHTPEHLSFLVTDTASADEPMGLFTGDFLFVNDVGRPDLLETAAGVAGSKEPSARQMFHSIQRIQSLPDYLQIWPGHGAGSACGKAPGQIPSSVLGYEKRFNRAFTIKDEDEFVAWLLDGQPEAPRYFSQMKRVNKAGPALLRDLAPVHQLDRAALDSALASGALVIDAREIDDFSRAHLRGVLNVPPVTRFNTHAGWFVNYAALTYLIADEADVERLVRDLRAIGVDNIPGYFSPDLAAGDETLQRITPEELEQLRTSGKVLIVDVRAQSEYKDERIPDARHILYGDLPQHVRDLPKDMLIVTQCASGIRSQIAASYLEKQGFTQVASLIGGLEAWEAAGLPLESSGF
ncbi:MAG: MBL fold metallo-hydrolase [Burkholderiales bacterium]|nr:MBL fold metallo-hydrolase [Anaerolineae bacterium]